MIAVVVADKEHEELVRETLTDIGLQVCEGGFYTRTQVQFGCVITDTEQSHWITMCPNVIGITEYL